MILVNATVPLTSLREYVNGTDAGLFEPAVSIRGPCSGNSNQNCTMRIGGTCIGSGGETSCTYEFATCSIASNETSCYATITGQMNTMTLYDQIYKGGMPANYLPVVPGDTYVITFGATFEDGSSFNATTTVVAF